MILITSEGYARQDAIKVALVDDFTSLDVFYIS
jgi:hypothetical protein